MNNDKGFTLIEILAVLIIVGIITTIGVKKFIDFDSSSEKVTQKYEEKVDQRLNAVDQLNEKMKDLNE